MVAPGSTPRGCNPPRVRARRGFETGNATNGAEAAQAETPLCVGLLSLSAPASRKSLCEAELITCQPG